MSIPVCNKCHQECDVRSIDVPIPGLDNGVSATLCREEGVSFCCGAGYTMPGTRARIAADVQAEEQGFRANSPTHV